MNINHTKLHLEEAMEQLQETISSFNKNNIDEIQFQIDMEHLFHHLNTAWNSRNATKKETNECSKTNYSKWGEFPKDIEIKY